jgi:hypothetical protein
MFINLLLLTVIILCYYAAIVKFAALLLRYTVSWKSSFLFALVMLTRVIILRWTSAAPLFVVICEMVVLSAGFCALGAWFFHKRIANSAGQMLGWDGSIRLSALALSMLLVLGIAVQIWMHGSHFLLQP